MLLKIKCLFPRNYYLLRKVNIKINNITIAHIGHNEVVELEVSEKDEISFKLDYHKTKIKISNPNSKKYLILYFDFRNYFPFYIIDIMFKNSLRAKFVDKYEFNNFNILFNKDSSHTELIVFNKTVIYTIMIGALISCQFIIVPLLNFGNSNNINNFSFFIGITSFIGFILMIVNKKNITNEQYNIRMLAFGIASFLLLIYIQYYTIFKIISIILTLFLILISINNLFNIYKTKSP